MDGSMGGFMGGMMGAMLGVMINISPLAVWVTTVFTTVICLGMYFGLIRLVKNSSVKQYAKDPVCGKMVDIAHGEADQRLSRRDGVLLRRRLQAGLRQGS